MDNNDRQIGNISDLELGTYTDVSLKIYKESGNHVWGPHNHSFFTVALSGSALAQFICNLNSICSGKILEIFKKKFLFNKFMDL